MNQSPLDFDLFGELLEDAWKKEWQDMPEFIQEEMVPYRELTLRFESQEDVDNFSKLVDQTINPTTTFIWYPNITIERYSNKRWVDASK